MWQWLRELYEINAEFRENKQHCKSCETLRLELDRCNREKSQLLSNLLAPKPAEIQKPPPVISSPVRIRTPWPVRQQMLEAEDRQKAKILQDLEERMGIKNAIPTAANSGQAKAERENSGGEAPRSGSEGSGEDSEGAGREEEKETARSADGSL
ncbi:MAG: hypothetical protein ABWY25_01440 [Paenisporosarcina sp.]